MSWINRIYKYSYVNYEEFFDSGPAQTDLEENLVKAYQIEYVLGEINLRKQMDPRLQFSHRVEKWEERLRGEALPLMSFAANDLRLAMEHWLSWHSGSGFADQILEEFKDYTDHSGMVSIGGGLHIDAQDLLTDYVINKSPGFVRTLFYDVYYNNLDEDNVDIGQEVPEEREYVRDYLSGSDFYTLCDMINNFDSSLIHGFINEVIYPRWRDHWSGLIEEPEENIQNCLNRLLAAISSGNLNELFVAVNVALQVRHVNGLVASDHADISRHVLDYLSNLDTDRLDELVDIITGVDWNNSRIGGNNMNWLKVAQGLELGSPFDIELLGQELKSLGDPKLLGLYEKAVRRNDLRLLMHLSMAAHGDRQFLDNFSYIDNRELVNR